MQKNKIKNKKILQRLGLNIKFYRNKLNFTQEKLAEIIDVERSYITAIEIGDKSPSVYCLYMIAKALNTSLNELMDINIE